MTCERAETCLHQSLDGTLSQPERVALDAHWEGCAACRRERDVQRRLAHLASQWSAQTLASSDPGEAFTAGVLARLNAPPKRSALAYVLPLGAALLLLLALFFLPGLTLFPVGPLASASARLPHWLAVNFAALPGDAQVLRFLPTMVFEPLWLRVLLPLAVGLNALFCLCARRNSLRRSVS